MSFRRNSQFKRVKEKGGGDHTNFLAAVDSSLAVSDSIRGLRDRREPFAFSYSRAYENSVDRLDSPAQRFLYEIIYWLVDCDVYRAT